MLLAETSQIKTKMVRWNVQDVASGTTVNALLYHSGKLLLWSCFIANKLDILIRQFGITKFAVVAYF